MQKVSLLVTTYNAKENLEITLAGIEMQDYGLIEVVIVDGGSNDGTQDVIREFAARHQNPANLPDIGAKSTDQGRISSDRVCIGGTCTERTCTDKICTDKTCTDKAYTDKTCTDRTCTDGAAALTVRWISEPDKGLYDAMNKAWAMCTGDIVAVCNDKLCTSDAVTKLVEAIGRGGAGCVGAHSDLVYVDGERVVRTWHMGEGRLKDGWMPGHPALFLKREIYERYGTYDISYCCAADYEFMVRFLKDENNRLAYVPEVLIAMFYGGTSNAGLRNYLVSFKEGYMALKKNGVRHPLFITVKRTFRVLRQF